MPLTPEHSTSSEDAEAGESLGARSVQGSVYSLAASAVTLTLGFVRAVLLVRLLMPEHFGVVALALFFLRMVTGLRSLGLHEALIHRPQADERDRATYFVMYAGLLGGSMGLLAAGVPLLARAYPDMPVLDVVLLALIGVECIRGMNAVQETLLSKRLNFRSLAVADVVASVSMTVVAPLLAWMGWGVWALVAEGLTGQLGRALVVWGRARAWRPRLGWHGETARWFWRYGRSLWLSSNAGLLLREFDTFWIGTSLGKVPLGYYSRAYEFAGYPQRVVANPLTSVFFPVFARVQNDPLRLAQAFFRVTSLMVRLGLGFSLLLILAAPEGIALLLGARWLPMQVVFQLLIVYAMLKPLDTVARYLLQATGHPDQIARIRVIQLVVFVPAVILGARAMGIEGVALAVDLSMLVGTVLLFGAVGDVITFSLRMLVLWPAVALVPAAVAALLLPSLWTAAPLWGLLLLKIVLIFGIYGGLIWIREREPLLKGLRLVLAQLRGRRP